MQNVGITMEGARPENQWKKNVSKPGKHQHPFFLFPGQSHSEYLSFTHVPTTIISSGWGPSDMD